MSEEELRAIVKDALRDVLFSLQDDDLKEFIKDAVRDVLQEKQKPPQPPQYTEMQETLTRKEAAEFLGVTEGTLAVWAYNKRFHLPFTRVGNFTHYKLSDLQELIKMRTKRGGV